VLSPLLLGRLNQLPDPHQIPWSGLLWREGREGLTNPVL
jgi:hypothetical protein